MNFEALLRMMLAAALIQYGEQLFNEGRRDLWR
jgi:hypothetical protein